ncbi:F-box protein [Hordeum vulgare]|nr:F-box protein [Hordeum vulgare]
MERTQDTDLLDENSPLLLFHYDYNEPQGETDTDSDASDEDGPMEDEQDDGGCQESYGTGNGDDEDEDEDEVAHKTNDEDEDEVAHKTNDAFLFYSITRRNLQSRRVDNLESHFYWITPQGWLLMLHHDSHATYLWNPFTRQRISLPPDQEEFLTKSTTRCLLSHKPTDPSCTVLVVNCKDTVLWYCRPEGDRWNKHTYESRTLGGSRDDVIGGMEDLTAVGGEFHTYFTTYDTYSVVILKFLPGPTFTQIPISDKRGHEYPWPWMRSFLLESCGQLFSLDFAQACHMGKVVHVDVRRLDMAQRAWLKVETLDDRVFFVNYRYFGASLSAQEVGLKGNCIYFLRGGDKGLYVYDMARGTTTLHNPGQELQDDVEPEMLMPTSS